MQQAREIALVTQSVVATQAGVTPTMVSLWERGRSLPRADRVRILAGLFHVTVDWILGQKMQANTDVSSGEVGRVAEGRPVYTIDPLEEMMLASVSIVGAVSAGGFVEAWQQDLGTLEVPSHVLREAPRAFGLRVYGNSLASEWIYEGAIVVVDPDASFLDGKIYAVMVNGEEVAARRIFQMGEQLKLVTGDGQVDEYSKDQVNIIGRVRWSFREH